MHSAGAEPCAVELETSTAAFLSRCAWCARVAGGDPAGSPNFDPSVIARAMIGLIRHLLQETDVRRLQTSPALTRLSEMRVSKVAVECVVGSSASQGR